MHATSQSTSLTLTCMVLDALHQVCYQKGLWKFDKDGPSEALKPGTYKSMLTPTGRNYFCRNVDCSGEEKRFYCLSRLQEYALVKHGNNAEAVVLNLGLRR
jgi:hypothetical protein